MSTGSIVSQHPEILNSWKEISTYLGRGIRTVQRWEQDLRLPVHRPRSKFRSAVMAFRGELDMWLATVDTDIQAIAQMDDSSESLEKLKLRLKQMQIERRAIHEKISIIEKSLAEKALVKRDRIEPHQAAA